MGRITRALSATGDKIKANRGAGDINEMDHLQPLGDDSKPLPQDDGYSDRTNESSGDVYLGAFDYENKIAEPGEKRTYARGDDGNAVSHVYHKKDGTIIIANDSYSKTISPDGSYIETNGSYSKSVSADGSFTETNGTYTKTVGVDGSINETNGAYSKTVDAAGNKTEVGQIFNMNGFIINPDGSATSPVSVGAPILTSPMLTANETGVQMGGDVMMNGENYNVHAHTTGGYKDAEDRPIVGASGPKV